MNGMADQAYMARAQDAALQSSDRSRQTGAVIVAQDGSIISTAANTFPDGIAGTEERHARPAKYLWTEHAERNAIYRAAAAGQSTASSRMYLPWYPCADCARAIIQSGIVEVVAIEPDWSDPKWAADFAVVREMLAEAGVPVRFMPGSAPVAK